MQQALVEIAIEDLTKKLQQQLKLGRTIKAVLPRYAQKDGGLVLEGYLAVVKVPKKDKLKVPNYVVN